MRRWRKALLIAAAAVVPVLSCGQRSLVLIDVRASTAFTDPTVLLEVHLAVTANRDVSTRFSPVRLRTDRAYAIGIYLPSDMSGSVMFEAKIDDGQCVIGAGSATATGVQSGETSGPIEIVIEPAPCTPVDGGAGGAGGTTGGAGTTGAAGTSGAGGITGAAGTNSSGAAGVTGAAGVGGTAGAGGLSGAAGRGGTTGGAGTTGAAGTGATGGVGGMAGTAGTGGRGGTTGTAGTSGTAGAGGVSGTAGAGGLSGAAGVGGTTGRGGTTGAAGTGATAGVGGVSGAAGTGGTTGRGGTTGAAGAGGAGGAGGVGLAGGGGIGAGAGGNTGGGGGTNNCATAECVPPYVCINNACVCSESGAEACARAGIACGFVLDNCGQQVFCSCKFAGQICDPQLNKCVNGCVTGTGGIITTEFVCTPDPVTND
jgi:hypothetical protein